MKDIRNLLIKEYVMQQTNGSSNMAAESLTTIFEPTSGQFQVGGISSTNPELIRRKIGVLPESMGRLWSKLRRMAGLAVILCFLLSLGATPALALYQSTLGDLQISISLHSKAAKTGDAVTFDTVVTNAGAQASAPVIVAMNIINLSKTGDVVDPEDWSPERTQYIDSLAPNQSTTLSWEVNAILDGDFMIYLAAIPQPQSAEGSSQVAASPGLHLTVAKFASLNPSGILPFVIGVPVIVILAIFLLFRLRRRQIDVGGD
jgi:hypothetical protein